MSILPARDERASALGFQVMAEPVCALGPWDLLQWRLRAWGVQAPRPLEGWWSPLGDPEPLVGRLRVKRLARPLDDLDDAGDLAPLFEAASGPLSARSGVTEVLTLELEPAFVGQRLGPRLLREGLAEVHDEELVVCEPKPTPLDNVIEADAVAAVEHFYRGIGFGSDVRLPGYLLARRAALAV